MAITMVRWQLLFMAVWVFGTLSMQSSSTANAASADASNKKKKTKKDSLYDTRQYSRLCGKDRAPITSKQGHAALQWLLQTAGHYSLVMEGSHQQKAACWILHDDNNNNKGRMPSPKSKAFAQRFALAVLYYATSGPTKWKYRDHWLTRTSECQWFGVECDSWGTVVALDLGFNDLNGLLPRELAVLQQLVEVDVHGNDLQGVVPHLIMAAWTKVEILRLHMNGFFGSLHTEIGLMKSLSKSVYVSVSISGAPQRLMYVFVACACICSCIDLPYFWVWKPYIQQRNFICLETTLLEGFPRNLPIFGN
jgi:hypothetical protein